MMDCQAWGAKIIMGDPVLAKVKIYNDCGQYCDTDFYVDASLDRQCDENGNTRLLLLRCGNHYELFSNTDLEGDK